MASLDKLDRRRHIEPYLNSLSTAASSKTGERITTAEHARRVVALSGFLADIGEWGWPDAPPRRLVFRSDIPRLPRPLPRYLPVDADRRLTEALSAPRSASPPTPCCCNGRAVCASANSSTWNLTASTRSPATGRGSKFPLGKLDTERMVPLDDETLALIDRVVGHPHHGAPLPHPRTGRPAEFLFTHHGRRLGQQALRHELDRAAAEAGIGHVTRHQLRHTYRYRHGQRRRVAPVAHGAPGARLGRDEPALRPAVRHHRARRIRASPRPGQGPHRPAPRQAEPASRSPCDGDWRHQPALKARLAGGYCLRAPAQGACPYANICEHCPNFRTDAASITVLSRPAVDTEALAADAEARGWIDEAERHRRLLARLDTLLAERAG